MELRGNQKQKQQQINKIEFMETVLYNWAYDELISMIFWNFLHSFVVVFLGIFVAKKKKYH